MIYALIIIIVILLVIIKKQSDVVDLLKVRLQIETELKELHEKDADKWFEKYSSVSLQAAHNEIERSIPADVIAAAKERKEAIARGKEEYYRRNPEERP